MLKDEGGMIAETVIIDVSSGVWLMWFGQLLVLMSITLAILAGKRRD